MSRTHIKQYSAILHGADAAGLDIPVKPPVSVWQLDAKQRVPEQVQSILAVPASCY
jgi:hypothetical protein